MIIPSSTAALVAFNASSILNFFSFISLSVNAPTLITATPSESLATLSFNLFLSYSDLDSLACARSSLIRLLISSLEPAPSIIVVLSLVTITLPARPKSSICISLSSIAKSLL